MIRLKLRREIILPDWWCDQQAFLVHFATDRKAFIAFLNDDPQAVYDAGDGLGGLIESYEWVEKP